MTAHYPPKLSMSARNTTPAYILSRDHYKEQLRKARKRKDQIRGYEMFWRNYNVDAPAPRKQLNNAKPNQ